MLPKNFPGRKAKRKKEAEERQKKWNALTIPEKLLLLTKRPGKSKKEREALSK